MRTIRSNFQQNEKISFNLIKNKILELFKSKFIFYLSIPIILLLLLFVLWYLSKIKTVECRIEGDYCPSIYILKTDEIIGKNLFDLDVEQYKTEILKNNFTINDISIYRKIPSKIIIELFKRQAQFLIVTREETFIADKNAFLMPYTQDQAELGLLPIETRESFALGQQIVSSSVLSAMEFAKLLTDSGIYPRQIEVIDINEINVVLVDGTLLRLNAKGDKNKQVDSIKLILSQKQTAGDKKINELDLRFNDPVIR